MISVIIPVYNSQQYICGCLDSIIKQTYKDFEIIIINDGSSDNSDSVILEYIDNHKDINFNYIKQENMGVAKTRNKAMKIAKGDYLVFVDNDDYLDEDYLEVYYNEISNGDLDAVIGGYKRPDENGKILREVILENEEWSKFKVMPGWAKMYKKSYILDNNIEYLSNDIGEDIYFNIQAMNLSDKIKIINYSGYNWFYNTESVSNTSQRNAKKVHEFYLVDSCLNVLKEKDILDKRFEILEMYFLTHLVWYLSYSTKNWTYKDISNEYDKVFIWLEKNFPNYRKNKLIGFSKPKGEEKKVRYAFNIFMIAKKLRLAKILLYLYSKI